VALAARTESVLNEVADVSTTRSAAGSTCAGCREPEEVANAVLFLASDLASAITGQSLDVNCGEFRN